MKASDLIYLIESWHPGSYQNAVIVIDGKRLVPERVTGHSGEEIIIHARNERDV